MARTAPAQPSVLEVHDALRRVQRQAARHWISEHQLSAVHLVSTGGWAQTHDQPTWAGNVEGTGRSQSFGQARP